MIQMNATKLPEKLSECLFLALDDLEKCEDDPKYVIDMSEWHTADDVQCLVCFAGSVMAKTCDADWCESLAPSNFGTHNAARFNALNMIRSGDIFGALYYLGIYRPAMSDEAILWACENASNWGGVRQWPSYRINPAGFKAKMRQTATELKELGL